MKMIFKCVKCEKDFGSKIVGNKEIKILKGKLDIFGKEKLKHKKCNGNIHPFVIIKGYKE